MTEFLKCKQIKSSFKEDDLIILRIGECKLEINENSKLLLLKIVKQWGGDWIWWEVFGVCFISFKVLHCAAKKLGFQNKIIACFFSDHLC